MVGNATSPSSDTSARRPLPEDMLLNTHFDVPGGLKAFHGNTSQVDSITLEGKADIKKGLSSQLLWDAEGLPPFAGSSILLFYREEPR